MKKKNRPRFRLSDNSLILLRVRVHAYNIIRIMMVIRPEFPVSGRRFRLSPRPFYVIKYSYSTEVEKNI